MIDLLLQTWRSIAVMVGDALFGRLLTWSHDVTLLALVLLSVAILVLVRRMLADQRTLAAASADLRTLRQLIGSTPASDTARRRRLRATRTRVAGLRLATELPAALLSLLLVSWILVWAWQRLEYRAPRAGDVLTISAHLPASQIGEFAHVVPQTGMVAEPTWVRPVHLDARAMTPRGRAEWVLTIQTPGEYQVEIRSATETMRHALLVGSGEYAPPAQTHAEGWESRLVLEHYHPFGLIPEFATLAIPAWLVAYVAFVLLGYQATRRTLGVF